MLQFLKDNVGQGEPELSPEEKVELEQLRTAYRNLRDKVDKGEKAIKEATGGLKESKKQKKAADSSSDSEVST